MSAINALVVEGTVDVKDRMEKIKSTGYWRVNIRPIQFEEHRIESLERCWEIMESCHVLLRGWDYPAVSEKEKIFGDDWVQSGADFRGMIELWKFYQSGQFIHYFSCLEDYRQKEIDTNSHWLGTVSTLYRITEIYEFAARLANRDVFKNQVKISIKLIGMMNRGLSNEVMDTLVVFPARYISKRNEINIESTLSVLELLGSAHNEAIDKTMDILSNFNYESSRLRLKLDQQRLLEKRLG